jgi:DNA-binding SARP family transcriptional activator/tetratricopeptide (TPR) repeat protein
MIYSLLGDLEIGRRGDEIRLPVGPTLIVLATLLINANRRMSKADLIRAAWGGEIDVAQLHKRAKDVRDLLKSFGRGEDMLTHPGFGYEIRVAEDDVDTLLFHRLVRDADEAGVDRRTEDEIGCLQRALKLWRGPHPLANVPGEAFRPERIALEQRHRRAAVRLFELELARGNHEHVLDQLIRLAAYYPSDRRLCEQLMLAAYRSGHPADANQAYERYMDALKETAGEPDALLRALHFAIGRGDEEAIEAAQSAVERRAGTPAQAPVAVPRQLPPTVDLVGRDNLGAEVAWLLSRERRQTAPVVVVSGPGGIGKTALALRAAHACADRYPDGQLFMELQGGAADTSEVLAQFLRAFGMTRVPEAKAERLAAYRTMLAGRRVLVMLDDAAGGSQVAELVPANPHCAVLVTARRRLPELHGAHHVAPLEPLRRSDATELFLGVVREAGLGPEDDLDAVGRVVSLCGGLPLALRIAGALRVHDDPRPTAELADRLARQGPDGFEFGELSVARTIGAGFERLDAGTRQLFLGLGQLGLTGMTGMTGLTGLTAFGRWTADALLAGTGADADVALSQLTASFMIEPVPAQMRYRFHDLTREYARRRALAEYPGEAGVVFDRVYRALLTLVRRAHAGLYGGDFEIVHGEVPDWPFTVPGVLAEVDASPLDWFERERANIRAAVEHCAALGLTDTCWDLAVSAHEFYGVAGYFDDWQTTHTVALQACRNAGDRRGEGVVLACLNQPALVSSRRSDGGSDLADLERAVELLTESEDSHGQAIAMRTLANALRRQGHLTRPMALFHEALFCYVTSGDTVGQWQTLRFIGQSHLDRGDFAEARRVLEESENLAVELGGGRLVAQTRYWIGQTCVAAGDVDEAQVAFDAVVDVFGEGGGIGRAYALHGLGQVATRQGTYGLAERYLTEAVTLAQEADAILEGRVLLSMAGLRRAEKQADQQIATLERTVSVFAGCGAAYLEIRALARLARAVAERGDVAAADAAWARIAELYEVNGVVAQDRLVSSATAG